MTAPIKSADIEEASGLVPRPDPTKLTTEALLREIGALREIMTAIIDGNEKKIAARLDGMDARFGQLHAEFDRLPAEIAKAVDHLTELHGEKFRSIQTQFTERDVRTEQTAKDSKVAVDAALQAAKEAVAEQNRSSALSIAKSETATMKQIDQLGVLIQTGTKATDEKIDDVKQRLTRMEGTDVGSATSATTHRSINSQLIAMIAMLVGLAGLVFGIIMAVRR